MRTSNLSGRQTLCVLAALCIVSFLVIVFSCCIGSMTLSIDDLLHAFLELSRDSVSQLGTTLVELRLHRALSAFVTGGTLALAGVLMQALLRNPLADPYVLGISGGAAVGALSAMVLFGLMWTVDLAAFGGAMLVAGLLFFLAYKDFKGSGSTEGSATTLLLTGVITGSGCMSLVTLLLSISPDGRMRTMMFWMIGDLSGTDLRGYPWVILVASLVYVCRHARAINVSAMYADSASTLGISIGRLRQGLFFCAALLTASAVSSAGSIGFVGLIMPHACRFAFGPDHRLLLPASCLAGGSFLVLADTLARTVIAPLQLPVGVITALIGVPIFLLQLHQHRQHTVRHVR